VPVECGPTQRMEAPVAGKRKRPHSGPGCFSPSTGQRGRWARESSGALEYVFVGVCAGAVVAGAPRLLFIVECGERVSRLVVVMTAPLQGIASPLGPAAGVSASSRCQRLSGRLRRMATYDYDSRLACAPGGGRGQGECRVVPAAEVGLSGKTALALRDVTKRYGDVCAVDALTASVPHGCIYGLLGPNGAGKTTALRMLLDIIRPDSGSIEVLGRPSPHLAKDRVGYMPEERGLYPRMTCTKVLAFLGTLKGVPAHTLAQSIPTWLGRVGLSDWAERKVHDLSRGMQQKLQFVATVVHEPDVVVLDEPFSGLDPVNLDVIKGLLLELRDAGKCLLLSTHVMEQAEDLCDRILLIDRGRKLLDGTLEEIRGGYESDVVSVEIEGDASLVAALPMVREVRSGRRRLDVELRPGADTQDFLRALAEVARVRAFEIRLPTLHEVFVEAVRGSDA
jgi:ABC-2 type transport system ATP-binding protein